MGLSDNTIIVALLAVLMALGPSVFFRIQFGGWLHNLAAMFGPFLQAYVAVALFAPLSTWFSWNVGLSVAGKDFAPGWSALPAVLAELYAHALTRKNLEKYSVDKIGSRYFMPDGAVISIPRGLIPTSILSAGMSVAAFYWLGASAQSADITSALKKYQWAMWVLTFVGAISLLRLIVLLLNRPTGR
jgi:hypothetical protein